MLLARGSRSEALYLLAGFGSGRTSRWCTLIQSDFDARWGLGKLVVGSVMGALLFGCSRTAPTSGDSHPEARGSAGPFVESSPLPTSSPSTGGEAQGPCVSASSFSNLQWVESVDPSQCVYDGERLAVSRVCVPSKWRDVCEYKWRPGLGRLYRFSKVRFTLESPPQWVRDIGRYSDKPCHYPDDQPFAQRFVVIDLTRPSSVTGELPKDVLPEPEKDERFSIPEPVSRPDLIANARLVPVLVNGHEVFCDWSTGLRAEPWVPTSEVVWSQVNTAKDTWCWPKCPEWVWRDHETVIVRPHADGLELVAYQGGSDSRGAKVRKSSKQGRNGQSVPRKCLSPDGG